MTANVRNIGPYNSQNISALSFVYQLTAKTVVFVQNYYVKDWAKNSEPLFDNIKYSAETSPYRPKQANVKGHYNLQIRQISR